MNELEELIRQARIDRHFILVTDDGEIHKGGLKDTFKTLTNYLNSSIFLLITYDGKSTQSTLDQVVKLLVSYA
jgi:hypothetical protein